MAAMTQRTPGQADTTDSTVAIEPTPLSATTADMDRRTGEPLLASVSSWAVLLAGFGLSAATWIALAELAGFTGHATLSAGPFLSGVTVTLYLAWLMPIAIDGYVVTALVLWMAPVKAEIAAFARKNTYAAAGAGVVAQSAYHALSTWAGTGVLWRAILAAAVGAMPPAVCALAVHMRALVRRHSGRWGSRPTVTTADIGTDIPACNQPDIAQVTTAIRMDNTVDSRPDTEASTPTDSGTVTPIAGRRRSGQGADVPIEDLADTLRRVFGNRTVGQPTAITELKRVHGSCSRKRAIDAKNLHNARVAGQTDTPPVERVDSDDDQEREPALATA